MNINTIVIISITSMASKQKEAFGISCKLKYLGGNQEENDEEVKLQRLEKVHSKVAKRER